MIVPARINRDLPQIVQIAYKHYFTGSQNRPSGFYNYRPPEEQLIRYLESNPYCLVARGDRDNLEECFGFLLAGDDRRVEGIHSWRPSSVSEAILNFPRPFVYCDMLATKNPGSFVSGKASRKLLASLRRISASRNVPLLLGVTAFSPWRNLSSERVISHLGGNSSGTIETLADGTFKIWEIREG